MRKAAHLQLRPTLDVGAERMKQSVSLQRHVSEQLIKFDATEPNKPRQRCGTFAQPVRV